MNKVIWICSIYPSKEDPFLGDFIERHAKAASNFNDITVIYVYTGIKKDLITIEYNEHLRAHVYSLPMNLFKFGFYQKFHVFKIYIAAVRSVIKAHGKPQILHVNFSRSAGIVGAWYSFFYSIPYVITEHWSGYLSGSINLLDKLSFSKAKKISAVSNYLGTCLQKIFKLKNVDIIPNVVDTEVFYYRNSVSPKTIFLHNSGEEMIKRSLDVVKTFSRNFSNSNFELHLYGTFREDIDLYISSNQLQNSVFQHGMVHQEELSKMMNEAISLVQFSSVETFGCIVAEALCCGLPVIVSDIPAMKELVTENVNGILVEKDDVNALGMAMKKMAHQSIKFDRPLIAASAKTKFSYEYVGKIIDDFYRSAL